MGHLAGAEVYSRRVGLTRRMRKPQSGHHVWGRGRDKPIDPLAQTGSAGPRVLSTACPAFPLASERRGGLCPRPATVPAGLLGRLRFGVAHLVCTGCGLGRSEEHTSELQSLAYLVCRLLLEKKKNKKTYQQHFR